ncbi:phosphotransferase [Catellatospora sp. KI3]|uniref:phosphotransferase n=1 Tax=Catellatospora sp. KI3 TaxID=3041620 RepID=UPI0024826538|nr:phosphotransferase [Catellatospora sp. KI3]MDI1463208.1 phosphotransferase [Catellatospora sp. KI3]
MLTPPDDLPDDLLRDVLAREWGLTAASADYRPVGWGSHHWEVREHDGTRWFATLDVLAQQRLTADEPTGAAFGRLSGALAAVCALRAGGAGFAIAPVPTRSGAPLAAAGEAFALALYGFVDGRSFRWGEWESPGHRRAVLDLVARVHAAPEPVRRLAPVDDLAVPHRDVLEAALVGGPVPDVGPYTRAAVDLVGAHAPTVRALLGRYDALVAAARAQAGRLVLTHGEPHPGNTMHTAEGWVLIDWDTARCAPPERDLWSLDPGDGSLLAAYEQATGVAPDPAVLELYRVRWDLSDLAVDTARFLRPHSGNADDAESWTILTRLLTHLSAP